MAAGVTWVIVSYGHPAQALELATSLTAMDDDLEVLLGCNGKGDFEYLNKRPTDLDLRVRAVNSPHNPGYMGFLSEVADEIPTDSIVVLSNADLRVADDFFVQLRLAVARFPETAVFAPAIIGHMGNDQNPYLVNPPSRIKLRAIRAVHRYPWLTDIALAIRGGGHSARSGLPGKSGDVIYAAHGSCMIFAPPYRTSGGTFGYPMFLFGEELWVATEVRRIGADVRYIPECRTKHEEHAATGSRRRGVIATAQYDSMRYWSRMLKAGGTRRSG